MVDAMSRVTDYSNPTLSPGVNRRIKQAQEQADEADVSEDLRATFIITFLATMADQFGKSVSPGFVRADNGPSTH